LQLQEVTSQYPILLQERDEDEPLPPGVPDIGYDRQDLDSMFSNVDLLKNVHKGIVDSFLLFDSSITGKLTNQHATPQTTELSASLQERWESWSNTQKLGDVFSTLAPYLKLYVQYINNYEAAMQTMTKCSTNPNFVAFLNVRIVSRYSTSGTKERERERE